MYGAGGESQPEHEEVELSSTISPMPIRTSTTNSTTRINTAITYLNTPVPCAMKHIIISTIVVSISFLVAVFYASSGVSNSLGDTNFPTPASSNPDDLNKLSGRLGGVFKGERVRALPLESAVLILNTDLPKFTWEDPIYDDLQPTCHVWGVLTTVLEKPSDSLMRLLREKNVCIVVVADKSTPPDEYIQMKPTTNQFFKFLTVEDQYKMLKGGLEIMDELSWNHFGRKNVGYLYAIQRGAKALFDMDDHHVLIKELPLLNNEDNSITSMRTWGYVVDDLRPACNPYPTFVDINSVEDVVWPRGFPLTQIQNKSTFDNDRLKKAVNVSTSSDAVTLNLLETYFFLFF
jgi:hypothetical protein